MLSSASKHCKSQILLLCCQGLSRLDVSSLNYNLEVDLLLFKSFLSKAGSVRYSKNMCILRSMHLDQLGFLPEKRIQHFRAKIVRLTCPTHSDLPSIDSVSGLLHPVGLPACGSWRFRGIWQDAKWIILTQILWQIFIVSSSHIGPSSTHHTHHNTCEALHLVWRNRHKASWFIVAIEDSKKKWNN